MYTIHIYQIVTSFVPLLYGSRQATSPLDHCQHLSESMYVHCLQPEKIQVPVQCHDGEEDSMEGLADPKVNPCCICSHASPALP